MAQFLLPDRNINNISKISLLALSLSFDGVERRWGGNGTIFTSL